VSDLFAFETAVIKTGDRQFSLAAGPLRDRQIAVARVGLDRRAGTDKYVLARVAESHVEDRPILCVERVGISRIPGRPRVENKVAAAGIPQRLVAVVLNGQLVGLSGVEWLGKNDAEVCVVVFAFLNE